MKTICFHCDKVLTDENGRHYSAVYDSTIKYPKPTIDITHALCENCYEELTDEQAN